MKRINLEPFKRFWAIAKLYWLGNEKKGAICLLALLALLLLSFTWMNVVLNTKSGELITALSNQDKTRFYGDIKILFGLLIIATPMGAAYSYLGDKLGLFWRRWLTNHFMGEYFGERSFYKISNFYPDIDNPDQRISQDLNSFCLESLNFFLLIISATSTVIAFSGVLWLISKPLVFFLLIYAVSGTLIATGFFGKKLVKLNYLQLQKEANFRFGLVRIRENAESIAFYQGEEREFNQTSQLFQVLYNNFNKLILWQRFYLGMFTNAYGYIPIILPFLVVGPSVFSGDLEVGKVSEAAGAFSAVFGSLNVIVANFQGLTSFVAGIDRLYEFHTYIKTNTKVGEMRRGEHRTIDTRQDSNLTIEHLTLQTPNYQRTLFNDVSFTLEPGQGLLVMGASGCGKSSLLRAIAGLWNSGTGAIVRPPLKEMLFLPQRPYMILGTLRDQLLYPNVNAEIKDEEIQKVLEKVNLPDLVAKQGGLHVKQDWSDVLSLGEQQRVAFARLLISQPKYAILDESTSALDVNNEETLYRHLLDTDTTFISVGHRPTLKEYHHVMLDLLAGGKWELSQLN